jgi:hypothetical protein
MREALIILPDVNHGATERLKCRLLSTFGGYTAHEVTGAWYDPHTGIIHHDTSKVFTVAADDQDSHCMLDIRNIAMEAGRMAGQISVYVRGFDGEVEFVNCSHMEG